MPGYGRRSPKPVLLTGTGQELILSVTNPFRFPWENVELVVMSENPYQPPKEQSGAESSRALGKVALFMFLMLGVLPLTLALGLSEDEFTSPIALTCWGVLGISSAAMWRLWISINQMSPK